jgi:hypothetical protein
MLLLSSASCVSDDNGSGASRGARDRSSDPSGSHFIDLLPAIASFKIDGTLDLPPDAAAAWRVPGKLRLTANYKATAKPIDQRPRYSSYEADFVLRVTDPANQRVFVDVSTGLSGTVNQTPDEAIGRPFRHLLDALQVLERAQPNRASPATAPVTAPSTGPSSQPLGFRAELKLSNLDIRIPGTEWQQSDGPPTTLEVDR